jgi:hypothetical protein
MHVQAKHKQEDLASLVCLCRLCQCWYWFPCSLHPNICRPTVYKHDSAVKIQLMSLFLFRMVSQTWSNICLVESQRLCNIIDPYMVEHIPNMRIPLITYLHNPLLRAVSKKKDPQSFFAIPTPPCCIVQNLLNTLGKKNRQTFFFFFKWHIPWLTTL